MWPFKNNKPITARPASPTPTAGTASSAPAAPAPVGGEDDRSVPADVCAGLTNPALCAACQTAGPCEHAPSPETAAGDTSQSATVGGWPVEARLAKSVPAAVQAALIRVCEATPDILALLLLDIRDPDTPGAPVRVLIELVLTDRDRIEEVAAQFQPLIKASPSLAGRTYFAATGQFEPLMRQALYRRPVRASPTSPSEGEAVA